MRSAVPVLPLAALLSLPAAAPLHAQDAPPPAQVRSIATVPVSGVSLSGSLSVENGRATIGNNGTIAAGGSTAHVDLTRGGTLSVCASTKVHLTTDSSGDSSGGALMIALDRGALEAHYTAGQYSDVLMTPDLRILISPPGEADLSLRVNSHGDTCLDNHGEHAPYVLVSNLFEGGAYRVQPNQRVLFEHGSLREVVDNEQEPCGCPPAPPLSVASAGATGTTPAQPVGKPSKTERDNPFPLAQSEGLAPPPPPSTQPVVPAGTAHAQVEAPLTYDSAHPDLPSQPAAATSPASPPPTPGSSGETAQAPPKSQPGLFGHIGHFFKKLFRR